MPASNPFRALVFISLFSLLLPEGAFAEGERSPLEEPPQRRKTLCFLVPLSGPYANLGRRVKEVATGFLEGRGKDLGALFFDSREPGPASQVQKAFEAGCTLLIGGLGDGESRAMSEAAENVGMPLINLGMDRDGLFRRHVIEAGAPRAEPIAFLAEHLVQALGLRYVSLLYPDSPFGRKTSLAFRKAFEKNGGVVLYERSVPKDEEEGKTVSLLASNPSIREACDGQALFLAFDAPKSQRLLAFAEFEGLNVRRDGERCKKITVVGTSLWNDPKRIERLGDMLDGAYFADVEVPEGNLLEGTLFDAVSLAQALLEVMEREGGRRDIAILAEGLKFEGFLGEREVREGRVTGRSMKVYRIEKGRIVPVEPGLERGSQD